jgi:glycosyltransferase involved in cell wall biosynthesis
VLARALGRMRRRGDRLPQVVVAGDGPERGRIESAVAEEGCRDHVRFLGQLSRTELAQAFQAADAAVQPSLSEGFSKAWLDAFAHGLPVVGSDVGAARHVIGSGGERGWLVRPGDPDALAAALRGLTHADLDWPALRRRCREYVEGRTLDVWARRIGELCEARWRAPLASRHVRRA